MLLAREIHNAQLSLTESSPGKGRASCETRGPMSPDGSRNKRRKTTTSVREDASTFAESKRRKSTDVFGLNGEHGENNFGYVGGGGEMRQALKEGGKDVRDLWEFPGSSASSDPLAPRREVGATRVMSRNAGGNTTSYQKPDRRQSSPMKGALDTHGIVISDDKSPKSTALRAADPSAGPSFKIDLTDPTLILTASQKEQYQQLSTTTSTPGSMPSPLPDEACFTNPYGKSSDGSSTILNSTPLQQVQTGVVEISSFSGTRTSPDVSVVSVPMQTPSQASQTGSRTSQTPRRSKSTLGLYSPDHDNSTSSMSNKNPKRRSKTTTSVSSQHQAEGVTVIDLSLPATVLGIPNTTAHKTTKKRKAKDVDDTKEADELASDEIAVGLPKEQYKPRPSRSRGSTNLNELLENVDFSKRPEAQVKAKNKRRKTLESDMPRATKEAVPTQVSQETQEGTTMPAADPSDPTPVHEQDVDKTAEDDTQPPRKPIGSKRKATTDEPTEPDANTKTAHAQSEPKAPTKPTTEKPAPKARGRPRKKTQEKALPTPIPTIVDETPSETTVHADRAPHHNTPSPHPDKSENKPDTALKETNPNLNSNSVPSAEAGPPPSTPPPPQRPTNTAAGTTPPRTADPATPSQRASDAPKGPQKHSPLNSGRVPYRVGLSKRARIEPLLRGFRK